MQTTMPFFESAEDALKAAVQALGGMKAVGPTIWPDKAPDAAARLLNDCLNPARSEKLETSQVMFILVAAGQEGFHTAFQWIAQECGYSIKPLVREEQVDQIKHAIQKMATDLPKMMEMLQRMESLK